MQITLDTDQLTVADAYGLIAIFREKFPKIVAAWNDSTAITTATVPVAAPMTNDAPEENPKTAFEADAEPVEDDDEEEQTVPLASVSAAAAPTNAELAAAIAAESARTSSPSSVELDKDGIPWDERIHAGTKGKNADGRWKRKKGINDEAFNAVKAELVALSGAPSAPPAPAPAPAAAAPPPPLPPGTDFASIMRRATDATNKGTITGEQVQGFVRELGLAKITDLIKSPDLLPQFAAKVDAQIELGEAMQAAGS